MTSFTWYDVSDATVGLLFGLAGMLGGYALRGLIGRWQADAIERQAKSKLEDAETEVRNRMKEADIQARAEVLKAREAFEHSTKARRKEQEDTDLRQSQREQSLDNRAEQLEKREQDLTRKRASYQADKQLLEERQESLEQQKEAAERRLQELAEITRDEARQEIYRTAEEEVKLEVAALVRRSQQEAKESADKEARELVTSAVQRYSVSHASEGMTLVVSLPNDQVKGRIIGREGRNIRTLETLTGVSILIDDTPEALVISAFDPKRREIARQTIERLVTDGRIHPAKIEEVVADVTANLENDLSEIGESAVLEARVAHVPPAILSVLGLLKFRTSFSQSVLRHSIEVANLMGLMAGELDLDTSLARRIGLFHDIGKALDQQVQGGHALIGADFLKKNGEDPVVVNAVAAHHEDVPGESLYAPLCVAADAISSSRPGARLDTTELYVQRLESLEAIATGFKGVKRCFAVQAGREMRVIVDPEMISDSDAVLLSREICRKIEASVKFPGQIKVIVVREMRCIEYAR